MLIDNGIQPETPETVSLGDFLERWLRTVVRPDLAESTYVNYELALRLHIIPAIGGITLAAITPAHIRSMLASVEGQGAKRLCFTAIKSAFTVAKGDGLLLTSPCDAVATPKSEREEIDPFTLVETELILNELRDHRLGALVRLAMSFGFRQSELFGLRWQNVDMKKGTLGVVRQGVTIKGRTHISAPKTKAGKRDIQLTDACVEALQQRRAISLKEGFAGHELVFPNRRGKVILRDNFSRYPWGPTLKALKLDHRGFHQCRHTAATRMLTDRVPVHIVSAILGHANATVTLNTYAKDLPDQQQVATESVARLLG